MWSGISLAKGASLGPLTQNILKVEVLSSMSTMIEQIPELQGQRVWLKPATMAERRMIYEWGTQSDLTPSMMGPPLFPDHMPPAWEEFCDDYKPYFFDDSAPELGRCFLIMAGEEAVGQVNYNDIDDEEGIRWTEL